MTREELRQGAGRIVEARRAVQKLAGLSDACRPRTLAEAYEMQRVATEQWGDEVVGWKVGATSTEIQKLFGMAEPAYGPLFKQTVFCEPCTPESECIPAPDVGSGIRVHVPRELAAAAEALRARGSASGNRRADPSHRDHQPEVQAADSR